MEYFENEKYIDLLLLSTEYDKHYKILEEMGFNKFMIKKVYAYSKPKSLEDSILFMSKNDNNIYEHEFFSIKENKCFYCGEESKYHINHINNKNIEKKDLIKLNINSNDNIEKNDIYKNDFDNNIVLEGNIEKNIEKNEEIIKKLKNKGKIATCKIIEKNQGSGFFCKISYLNKTIKILFTNNHI